MTKMRKIVVSLGFILAFAGCESVNTRFAQTIKASTDLILPDYVAYVDNDLHLDPDSKDVRKNLAAELERLLTEASEEK